ncbi:MAG: 3-deoxy-manno-octulosonate-8-phosphatase KdsC [Gammaproteobacteria bacterium]|nr:3-deoxy-manno-octulosonate-8-phosphatase KdsC [Gammaproteobacteria bacterium]
MPLDSILEKAKPIKLLICDVDGVMTDGSLYYDDNGYEFKSFNSLDGHGIKMLKSTGVDLAIITGRTSNIVLHRMKNLGIDKIYQGQEDKVEAFEQLIKETGLLAKEIAYIGDDVVDLPVMTKVGFSIAVANSHEFVIKHAHWKTQRNGGHGAVREACEFIISAQGNLDNLLNSYL